MAKKSALSKLADFEDPNVKQPDYHPNSAYNIPGEQQAQFDFQNDACQASSNNYSVYQNAGNTLPEYQGTSDTFPPDNMNNSINFAPAEPVEKKRKSKKKTKRNKNGKQEMGVSLLSKVNDAEPTEEIAPPIIQEQPQPTAENFVKHAELQEQLPDEKPFDYEAFENEIDQKEHLAMRRKRKNDRRQAIMSRVSTVIMILACVYLIFLIYGAINTEYVYNDNGEIVPQVMSVMQIQRLNDFGDVASEYRQARTLYEQVLKLDYRIAAGIEDPLLIAPEYEAMLDKIEALVLQCQALSVATEYTQLHAMITTWTTTDIAIYCQNMSKAITSNDAVSAQRALETRQLVYNDFSVITEVITTMGATVDGAEIKDMENWSPEKFINENIGEIGGGL